MLNNRQLSLTILIAFSCLLAAGNSIAQEFAIEEGTLYQVDGETKAPIELEGQATAVMVTNDLLYVAVGGDQVHTFRIDPEKGPQLIARKSHGGGLISGFVLIDGEVWAKVTATTAIPMDALAAATTPARISSPSATAAPASPSPKQQFVPQPRFEDLKIVHLSAGEVQINKGEADGVIIGDRFAIFRSETISKKQDTEFVGEKVVAIAKVIAVNETTALAKTGRSQRVYKSDQITPATNDQRLSTVGPRRIGNITELSATLRPIIHIGDRTGFGALTNLEITHYTSVPMFLRFRTEPLGLGFEKGKGAIVFTNLVGEIGYDGQYLGIGLGAALGLTGGDFNEMVYGGYAMSDGGEGVSPSSDETHAAFGITQFARLGPRDGLRGEVRSLFFYQKKSNETNTSSFQLGSITGAVYIPIASLTDLVLEGGGGLSGFGFGSIGISSWVIGNGDKGSLAVSAHVGGAGMWVEEKDDTAGIAGPMAGIGIKYRL